MPKTTPAPLSFNAIMINYLEKIHKLDPEFFPALAAHLRTEGRLFFNLVLPDKTIIHFPTDEAIVNRLSQIDISSLKSVDPVISLTTITAIQQFAHALSTLITNAFLPQLSAAINPADHEKLERIISHAVTYKVWCTQEGLTSKDNIQAKVIAAILASNDDPETTYLTLSVKYQTEIISRLNALITQYESYLKSNNSKLAKATFANIDNYLQQIDNVIEYRCLDDMNKTLLKATLTMRHDQLKAAASLADDAPNSQQDVEKTMQKGQSVETSTPAKSKERPSPRRQTSLSNLFKLSPKPPSKPDQLSPKGAGSTPRP